MKDNKNRPHILDNLGLKVTALLIAIVVWVLINNVNDPVKYMRITNVQVKLLHTSMITDQGDALSEKYDKDYYSRLSVYLSDISDEEADCMIGTIEKFYKVMSERRVDIE